MALKIGDRVRVKGGIPAHELEDTKCGGMFDDPAGMAGVITYDGRKWRGTGHTVDLWPIGVDLDDSAAGHFPRFFRPEELEAVSVA